MRDNADNDKLIAQAHREAWPRKRLADAVTQLERERCLAITKAAVRADGDGRDLVVRTDIIRKIQHN